MLENDGATVEKQGLSVQSRGELLGEFAAKGQAAFGTSGVRARVENLTPELCWAYTCAFLSILDRAVPVLIGHDLRPSSPRIAEVCHAAAHALGFETVHAGAVPTPALAYASQMQGAAAIMVTGSHIPFDWNGIKFYRESGEITKDDERRILACPVNPLPCQLELRSHKEDLSVCDLYLDRYRRVFAADELAGLRIGVYEHSSVARDLLHQILRDLGASTISLRRTDNFVAVDTEALTAEDHEMSFAWANAYHLDAIVTTDGDGDRPLVADESGRWLRGDLLGLICALEISASSVVTPITSTTAVEIRGKFQEIIRTRVGSPYVIAGMQQSTSQPVIGFEANGGVLLGSDILGFREPLSALWTRDSMLPILLVLRASRRFGSISALVRSIAVRHSSSDRVQNINLDAGRTLLKKLDADPELIKQFINRKRVIIHFVDRTDGVRVVLDDGDIIHFRLSGNAPEIRCYVDASDARSATELCQSVVQALRQELLRFVSDDEVLKTSNNKRGSGTL